MTSAARARAGMSLVELIVALSILGGALLGLAMFSARFSHSAALARIQNTGLALAVDRIEQVKSVPSYTGIDAYAVTEASIPGYPGFQRRTMVLHTGGAPPDTVEDYRVVTVIVSNPQLTTPVKKTTFIAAF